MKSFGKIMSLLIIVGILLVACKPTTFIISKGTRGYYFGRQSKSLYRLLCASGDFKKVLRDANIPEDIKSQFYEYVCTKKASKDKVVSLYLFLTPEEKKSLKRAFIKHGYTVNYVPC